MFFSSEVIDRDVFLSAGHLVQHSENKHIIDYLNYLNDSMLLMIFRSMFIGCSGQHVKKDSEGQQIFFKENHENPSKSL